METGERARTESQDAMLLANILLSLSVQENVVTLTVPPSLDPLISVQRTIAGNYWEIN